MIFTRLLWPVLPGSITNGCGGPLLPGLGGVGTGGINATTFVVIEFIFLACILCYQESGHFKASMRAAASAHFWAKVSYGPRTHLVRYVYLLILLIILQPFVARTRALWLIHCYFVVDPILHGPGRWGVIVFSIIARRRAAEKMGTGGPLALVSRHSFASLL